jgi:hypothetical protein
VEENGGESCQGRQLRFRLVGSGSYSVRFQGSRLDIAALGRGSASIGGSGSYSLDGKPYRRLPARGLDITF